MKEMVVPERDRDTPVRIMLVEDHAPFRRAMVYLLNRQPDLEVVSEAGSLDEARRNAALVEFDMVVLDLRLPDGNGIDVIGELRGARPGAAVVILSATLDPANLSKAKEAGADGLLDKFATPDEVVGTIRRVRSEQA